jgi:[protein-PII] uridylyltransferase
LLSTCAGVLALNQLDVRAAKMTVEDGYGTGVFAVRPRFGRAPVPEILADAVHAALEGTLPLADRLRQREADYRQDGGRTAPPRISWHDGEASGTATGIVEVRAADRAGLLYRLTTAITGEGLDVTSALIETLGADAVDCFYVCNPSGSPVEPEQRRRVDDALVSATLGAAADERPRADTPGRFR